MKLGHNRNKKRLQTYTTGRVTVQDREKNDMPEIRTQSGRVSFGMGRLEPLGFFLTRVENLILRA